ncbi:MAG: ABC transporter permease [Clostridiales bacterium]|jgi:ABC-type antimicrobial peptide transport system permease subunit|nr:ABC transporter permease [Clostridiales bacterium]
MSILDIFTMALRNMLKRKLRTILTVSGVAIGSVAITLMVSLGVAVNLQHQAQIEQMGHRANRITVWGPWSPGIGDARLDAAMLAHISNMPGVQIATPQVWQRLTFVNGPYVADIQVMGVVPEAMPYMGLNVAQGRNLTDEDELQIVFASNVLMQFRNPRDRFIWDWDQVADIDVLAMPMRASFDFNFGQPRMGGGMDTQMASPAPYLIEGIGILDGIEWEAQQNSFMPLEQVLEIQRDEARFWAGMGGGWWGRDIETDGFEMLVVIAESADTVSGVAEEIEALGFSDVWYDMYWMNLQRESTQSLQNLLLAVGAVSLVVAAIGIANTMIMAIYERTKEIGVMKVIGASIKDVRRLFLLEASMIGAFGGLLGVGISAAASYALNTVGLPFLDMMLWADMENVSVIPVWLYVLGFGFSAVVGLISGFLPARRATKISALEAIRTA